MDIDYDHIKPNDYEHLEVLIKSAGFRGSNLYCYELDDIRIIIIVNNIKMYSLEVPGGYDSCIDLLYNREKHTDEYTIKWLKDSLFELQLLGVGS